MSTRAFVIIKDEYSQVQFYRHSDGYPEGAGADLTEFVKDYQSGAMRLDAQQSSGWLVLRGHLEYMKGPFTGKPDAADRGYGWKCGAYEPAGPQIPDDVEYVYTIDLVKCTLVCRPVNGGKGMKLVKFERKGGTNV